MIDLMEKFAEARFGKRAFLGRLFGSMDPKKRAIRDRIEDLIREERRKRESAQAAIAYGKQRLEGAGKPSTLGWVADISRSLVPGLSISADTARRMVKTAAETPADRGMGGRLFDLAHLGAGAGGAGLGYAASQGAIGDVGSVTRLAHNLGDPLSGKLTKVLGGGTEHIGAKHPELLALAAQGSKGGTLAKLTNLISPRYWWRKAVSKAPTTPEQARGFIGGKLLEAGKTGTEATTALSKLKGLLGPTAKKLTSLGARAKRIKLPGKWGAIAGAVLATLPFIAARLYKTRKLRATGGTAGQEAARKAEELLGGAQRLRQQREQLMQQLA